MTGHGACSEVYRQVERRSLMRGSSKILMALVAMMILAAPFARAQDDLALPTDKTSGTTYKLVRFDGVVYRIFAEVPCELYFQKVDSCHHRFYAKPVADTVTPFCEVSVQWGSFPTVSLFLETGGTNSWILGTETGYAEK
jgi:hypothetical protein